MNQLDKTLLLLLTAWWVFHGSVYAQTKVDSILDLGKRFENNAQYLEAIEVYQSGFSHSENKWDDAWFYYRISKSHQALGNLNESVDYLKKSLRKDPSDLDLLYDIAVLLRETNDYKEAAKYAKRYIKKTKEEYLGGKARGLITGMDNEEEWLKNPCPFKIVLDKNLSSTEMDFAPVFVDQSRTTIMLSSNRHVKKGDLNAASRSAVYLSTKSDQNFGTPTLVDTVVGKRGAEGAVTFDFTRDVIFFTSCDYEYCELRYAFLSGDMKGQSLPIRFEDQAEYDATFGHPSYSLSTKTLYFVSDMEGGYGGRDIWFSRYLPETDSWSAPANAGPAVNSQGDEMFPTITEDNRLYFSSNGHPGFGGLDLFKVELVNESKGNGGSKSWSNRENLGFPLNSKKDDFGIVFDSDSSGFFASNRKGGLGSDDIYWFTPISGKQEASVADNLEDDIESERQVNNLTEFVNREVCEKPLEIEINTSVYPNPSDGQFNLILNAKTNSNAVLRIYSSSGKLVSNQPLAISEGKTTLDFNISSEPVGVYYVQILVDCESKSLDKVILR